MNDDYSLSVLTIAALAGLFAGGLYFGGLWMTVRRAAGWRYPGLGMAISLFLRLAMLALILYIIADGHWQRYIAVVPGFLAARWFWIRRLDPSRRTQE